MKKNQEIYERISSLEHRFDSFESLLCAISKKVSRTKGDPIYLTWREAAERTCMANVYIDSYDMLQMNEESPMNLVLRLHAASRRLPWLTHQRLHELIRELRRESLHAELAKLKIKR